MRGGDRTALGLWGRNRPPAIWNPGDTPSSTGATTAGRGELDLVAEGKGIPVLCGGQAPQGPSPGPGPGNLSPPPSSGRCALPPSTTCWTTPPSCSPALTSSKSTPPRAGTRPSRRSATGRTRFNPFLYHFQGALSLFEGVRPDYSKVCESHELCQHKKPQQSPSPPARPSPRGWPGTGGCLPPEVLPKLTPEMLEGPAGQVLQPAGGGRDEALPGGFLEEELTGLHPGRLWGGEV